MMRPILLATLVVALTGVLAGCSRYSVSPHEPTVEAFAPAFNPYCGPIWSVRLQGYLQIPCPAGSSYLP